MGSAKRGGVVLLLGQPGVGKSLLGERLAHHLGGNTQFLNVGKQLRECGLVESYQEHPTEAGRRALAAKAQELRAQAFSKLAADSADGNSRVLVLEGVKNLEDGYSVLDELRQFGLELLQVILLNPSARSTLAPLSGSRGMSWH